jgi:hypothetical protein
MIGKSLGTYTARGTLGSRTTDRIRLFDGSFETGHRITKFVVAPVNPDASANAFGYLATAYKDDLGWDWSDNREIGWSSMVTLPDAGYSEFSLVDRDNLVIEDLYIFVEASGGGEVNYYIEMEKFEISPALGAVTMAKDNSSDSGTNWT